MKGASRGSHEVIREVDGGLMGLLIIYKAYLPIYTCYLDISCGWVDGSGVLLEVLADPKTGTPALLGHCPHFS